jgi:hydroxypyruvate reductase
MANLLARERQARRLDLMETTKDSREAVALAHPYLEPFLREAVGTRYRIVELAQPPSKPGRCLARAVIVDGSLSFDTSLHLAMPNLGLIACFNTGYDGIDLDWGAKAWHRRDACA